MYRSTCHIIVLLLCSLTSFSQSVLKGRVLNEESNQPLVGASIYINNTSVGTTSNQAGEFSLTLPAIANPELIVSSIGFDVLVYKIHADDDHSHRYVFKLKAKQTLMQDVLILPDAIRQRYLKIFKENFLGLTEEAASSTIKNLDAVYFARPPGEKNSFIALSDTPLVILNRRLGYKIHFQLQEFYYNEVDGNTSFYGFTRYEEIADKKRFDKRRRRTYYGSSLHFFRSLIADKLSEQSFKMYVIVTDTLKSANGRIEKMDMAIPVTVQQILKKDSANPEQFIATWKNRLMVQYGKEPASKVYLRQHTFLNGSLPVGFRSQLILKDEFIGIDKNGIIINPMGLSFSGYWIYEKAANLLPYDYDPK